MNEHLRDLEAVAHEVPLAKRRELGDVFNRLAVQLGLAADEVKHLTWPAAAWPSRGESSVTRDDALRYLIDFGHGDEPDHRDFVATFEEVRHLLNYTRDSCKVAFGTHKGKIDRTQRPTKLGPCIIHRLPAPIQLSDYPSAVPLQVKVEERTNRYKPGSATPRARGNKY